MDSVYRGESVYGVYSVYSVYSVYRCSVASGLYNSN